MSVSTVCQRHKTIVHARAVISEANFIWISMWASDLIPRSQNCMHAVFELVLNDIFVCFVKKRILGNKAEEMKLNFNLFLWPALMLPRGFSRLTFVTKFIRIYCQNCRMAKQTNQVTLPKRLISFRALTINYLHRQVSQWFVDEFLIEFSIILLDIATAQIKLIKNGFKAAVIKSNNTYHL